MQNTNNHIYLNPKQEKDDQFLIKNSVEKINPEENINNPSQDTLNINNKKGVQQNSQTPSKDIMNNLSIIPQSNNKSLNNSILEKEERNIFNITYKEKFVFFEPDLENIKKYQNKLNSNSITDKISKYYSLKSDNLTDSKFYEYFNNYISEIAIKEKKKLFTKNYINLNNNNNNVSINHENLNKINFFNKEFNKRKIIYIHDSAMQLRSKFIK